MKDEAEEDPKEADTPYPLPALKEDVETPTKNEQEFQGTLTILDTPCSQQPLFDEDQLRRFHELHAQAQWRILEDRRDHQLHYNLFNQSKGHCSWSTRSGGTMKKCCGGPNIRIDSCRNREREREESKDMRKMMERMMQENEELRRQVLELESRREEDHPARKHQRRL